MCGEVWYIFCGQIVHNEPQGFHSLNLSTDWSGPIDNVLLHISVNSFPTRMHTVKMCTSSHVYKKGDMN